MSAAKLQALNAELLAALKKCAAVCAGEVTSKRELIEALETARAAMAKAAGESA